MTGARPGFADFVFPPTMFLEQRPLPGGGHQHVLGPPKIFEPPKVAVKPKGGLPLARGVWC
ncbi:MAG: hypothetical protein CM1200mP41_09960 [Gammaproteobacteria bacterium]|nr:MAG: hypothetical protein CM1200mP41_09960 [Gammaproteobacteria bacterium]